MSNIIWLASYPKSGNTWLRELLTNYRRDADTPADINQLEGGPNAGARMWFDEWCGVEASALSDAVIRRLRPGVYRCLAREAPQTLFMKVHDAWGRTDRAEPLFPPDVTAGVIYIVRNPLDVVTSWAHHAAISLETATDQLCDSTHALSRSRRSLSDQLRQHLGSWSEHVRSWQDESGLRIHTVRYEDLRRNPEAGFAEFIRFSGLPLDLARVRKAVQFSDFAELRRQEQERGFRERSPQASTSFFRRGQSGSWRDELSPELAQRLIATHRETMARFGYLDEE